MSLTHCIYLVFQLNVGCFMVGPPNLGPGLSCVLSAQASTIVCNPSLVASATALAIASLMICSDAIISLFLYDFFTNVLFLLLTPYNKIMPYNDDDT